MNYESIIAEVLKLGKYRGEAAISSEIEFMEGVLYTVEFSENGEIISERFFWKNTKGHSFLPSSKAFSSKQGLMDWINTEYSNKLDVLRYAPLEYRKPMLSIANLADVRVVAGIISISITATIAFLLISDLRHQQPGQAQENYRDIVLGCEPCSKDSEHVVRTHRGALCLLLETSFL